MKTQISQVYHRLNCPHDEHYANMSVQYTAIFHGCKNDNFQMKINDIFLIFAQNIDSGTHNLCFRAKIRKKCIPL